MKEIVHRSGSHPKFISEGKGHKVKAYKLVQEFIHPYDCTQIGKFALAVLSECKCNPNDQLCAMKYDVLCLYPGSRTRGDIVLRSYSAKAMPLYRVSHGHQHEGRVLMAKDTSRN